MFVSDMLTEFASSQTIEEVILESLIEMVSAIMTKVLVEAKV